MRTPRTPLVGIVLTVALWLAVTSANAAVVTFPVVGITATSQGTATLAMGTTTLRANLTLAGSTFGGDYRGTLGSTNFDIAAIIATNCRSATAGFTVGCVNPPSWGVDAIVNGNVLTTEIHSFRITFTNSAGTISCALHLTVHGRYDRGGLLTVTSTTLIGAAPQPPGACPAGTPVLTSTFTVSPAITWTLVP